MNSVKIIKSLFGLGRRNDFIVVDGKVAKCWCGTNLVESNELKELCGNLRLMLCHKRGFFRAGNNHLYVFLEKE